jgi:hypothetical protein
MINTTRKGNLEYREYEATSYGSYMKVRLTACPVCAQSFDEFRGPQVANHFLKKHKPEDFEL